MSRTEKVHVDYARPLVPIELLVPTAHGTILALESDVNRSNLIKAHLPRFTMSKIDPYKHEFRYRQWKEQGGQIVGIAQQDAELVRRFIGDLELGLNVSRSSKRGARSFIRLNTLRVRLGSTARLLRHRFPESRLTELTEKQIHEFFNDMRIGVLRKQDGESYQAVRDYIKDFRTFWRWYIEVKRQSGATVSDITAYLDARGHKPRWVYLTEDQVRQLCDRAKYEYRVLIMFLLDSGIRSPSELVNIRVSDFDEDFKRVHVRDEVSKTFGRRINLMLCSSLLADFVRRKDVTDDDVVFNISPGVTNRYLKRLAKRVLGSGKSLGGECYSNLTMYDLRHVSACYWLPRYKSESALKYRFGWKQSERIHYYTELLGMKDNITEGDLLFDDEKTALERRLSQAERDKEMLQERLDSLQRQMEQIATVTDTLLKTSAPA